MRFPPVPRPVSLVTVVALLGTIATGAEVEAHGQSSPLAYPAAPRAAIIDTLHGIVVPDPYRWLERPDSDQTRGFVRAQDSLLESYVSDRPEREELRRRVLAIGAVERQGPFFSSGQRIFTSRIDVGGALLGVSMLRGPGGEPRPILEPATLPDDPELRLASFTPSPDGRFVAYNVARGQSRWQRVRIREVDPGTDLDEEIAGIRAPVVWSESGEGFFYVQFEVPPEGRELEAAVDSPRVLYHRLGTDPSADRLVYERPDHPDWLVSPSVTEDGRTLILSVAEAGSFTGLAEHLYAVDLSGGEPSPGAGARPLAEAPGGAYALTGKRGQRFWIRTSLGAPRGRIVAIDASRPDPDHWTEVIPESAETMTGARVLGGRLIVQYVRDALPLVRVFDLSGRFQYELDLPDIGAILGWTGRADQPVAYYRFQSLYDPGTIYRLDVTSGESTIFLRPDLPYDPDHFVTRQVFYQSADGTRVPMFVSHRRDLELDGRRPTFQYAYGAFAWIAFPWFQPHVIAWMERGGVYALPGIRGGGEYGAAWHEAGRRRNKPNAIADYIAATEWLIANGYTDARYAVANGGSASGVVAAAAAIRRPDLYGAAVIDIPALDMLRYDRFTVAGSWVPEFGTAEDPQDFRALRSYSPYHTLRDGTCYPPTLVIVGEKDEIAPPFHGYKFTAALQRAQGCPNPALLKVVRGAGHTYGMTPEQVAATWADAWAFLAKALAGSAAGPSAQTWDPRPELFAPGIVSTGDNEFSTAFTPDERQVYWSISAPDRVNHPLVILTSHREDGDWGTPRVADFSGGPFSDADPFVTRDGARLFFMSRRPVSGVEQRADFDIWVADKTADGWGEPGNLGPPVNTDDDEIFPSVTADGTLYFASGFAGDSLDREGRGSADIYRSRHAGGSYQEPENLGDAVNTEFSESNPYIAPDEAFLIFGSDRPGGLGGADLYVTRNRDGSWTPPVNLGASVNSPYDDYAPAVSPDGKRLFFTSRRPLFGEIPVGSRLTYEELLERIRRAGNGNADVYSVEMESLGIEISRP